MPGASKTWVAPNSPMLWQLTQPKPPFVLDREQLCDRRESARRIEARRPLDLAEIRRSTLDIVRTGTTVVTVIDPAEIDELFEAERGIVA